MQRLTDRAIFNPAELRSPTLSISRVWWLNVEKVVKPPHRPVAKNSRYLSCKPSPGQPRTTPIAKEPIRLVARMSHGEDWSRRVSTHLSIVPKKPPVPTSRSCFQKFTPFLLGVFGWRGRAGYLWLMRLPAFLGIGSEEGVEPCSYVK